MTSLLIASGTRGIGKEIARSLSEGDEALDLDPSTRALIDRAGV